MKKTIIIIATIVTSFGSIAKAKDAADIDARTQFAFGRANTNCSFLFLGAYLGA